MKKIILMLTAVLMICMLAGCGGQPSGEDPTGEVHSGESASTDSGAAVDLESIKTLGDAFALNNKDEYSVQRSTYQGKYVYVFTVDGTPYRVIADLPADIEEQIFALEFDEDHDANEEALVADLPVASAEDLTALKLPQEDLDALVGKTGQELFDAGWRGGSFYNTETLEVWLEYGPFAYDVHFDGKLAPEDAEDFDFNEDLADKKVVDIAFEGLGDATNIE